MSKDKTNSFLSSAHRMMDLPMSVHCVCYCICLVHFSSYIDRSNTLMNRHRIWIVKKKNEKEEKKKSLELYRSKGIHQGREFFDTINGYLVFSIYSWWSFVKLYPLSYFLYRSPGPRSISYEICWRSYTAQVH